MTTRHHETKQAAAGVQQDYPQMSQQMRMAQIWKQIGPRFLPFADAATAELPMGRLPLLAWFQPPVVLVRVRLDGNIHRVPIVHQESPA